jgi:hypothetical protein
MSGSGGSRRGPIGIAIALVVLVAAGVVGWRVLASHSGSSSALNPSPTLSSAAHVSRQAQLGTLLERVAVRTTDLQHGYTMQLVPAGDQVAGQVTLDNCGFRFTTEAHRVARRQYALTDAAGRDAGMGNEVVAYDSPAHAAAALAQWHRSAATCPRHAVASTVAGMPRLVERVKHNQLGYAGLPVRHNVVTVESASARRLGTLYMIAILQVHGRVLDAVYLRQSHRPQPRDLAAAVRIAKLTGRRLAHSS